MRNRRIATAVAAAWMASFAGIGLGHPHEGHENGSMQSPENLGKVIFPTSCSTPAQAKFQEAVALLHSFEYERAARRFQEVSSIDADCAMSYWGAAMALYHPIWQQPSDDDLSAGWKLIQKARSAAKKSRRETAWIEALSVLYQPGSRAAQQRTDQYSEAMGRLRAAFPTDAEASVFYALSLLAAATPSDTELVYNRKAVSILNEVLQKQPDHPGVAHYLIHACDNPKMAQQGLAAARRYAGLAPASPHALHMPSHIFTRLGLWDEDIASNRAAIEAAEKRSEGIEYTLHPMHFLEYAYLQTGQVGKARAIAEDAMSGRSASDGHGDDSYHAYVKAQFPALLTLETRDWRGAEGLQPLAQAEPGDRGTTFWAQSVGAGHLRDVPAAQAAAEALDKDLAASLSRHPDTPGPPVDASKNEAHAWLAFAQGDYEAAFGLLRPAIDYQDKVGKGEVAIPAREMYADMLLELGRPEEALQQYRLSLQSDPNRFNGLFGAAQAAERLRRSDVAGSYYKQLLANCAQADDPPRSELRHASQFMAH